MIKKTLEWKPESLFSGKGSKRFWKQLNKAKSKKELADALHRMAFRVEVLEDRLVEMKKFIGDRREY